MAAARDQAARIVRTGPETAEDEAAREAADQLRTQVAEEPRRRPAETPDAEGPGAPSAAADAAAAKPGKRKFIMIGVLGLLALAAIGYGVYFVLVGRFYVSTDDAYVRVACGLDYRDAAPFSGTVDGGGRQEMEVRVEVQQIRQRQMQRQQ